MIHEKLKELRKSRGITQEEMAAALHKSQNAYSIIELGKSKLDAELVPDVCKILNITPLDLFSNNSSSYVFNEKVENGYATYIQTVNATNIETLNLLKTELDEKNNTIKSLLNLLNNSK
ncbi:MAG: DNA-binding helix-turn-helix protein [Chitinophagaceae bacterium]|nr:MAG: DNA-binding helix-turn-helix protein [Chitinophagaceae bacterium]